jgi:hypothetical protein
MLVREVETSSAARAVKNILLWRLGVWAFIALVGVSGMALQHGATASSGPPRSDPALELTDEERAFRVCLPPPEPAFTPCAVRAETRLRAPSRAVARDCPSCHKDVR